MPERLLECVPNFSEGRDGAVIEAVAAAIRGVEGVRLLGVDPGRATNRTVYTFVGEPEAVCEAAFRAAQTGKERMDMRRHQGEHPRMGFLDVCPVVPVAGLTLDEAAEFARKLGKRLGEELGLTIYLYEHAATRPERKNLADIRAGEYEGLATKLQDPNWKPDFGPAEFQEKWGATAVGARDFLIAYNINLNTTSTRRANAVAFDVREKGRVKRIGDPLTGEVQRDQSGDPVYEPGTLKGVKAIGWFIEEYGIAQISMNLTSIRETPIHVAFEECAEKANARGLRVTGSELVGLIPLEALLEAGRHFLRKQKRSVGVSDAELIKIAIRTMGLDELSPFDPKERIIEYAIRDRSQKRLADRTLEGFVEETASESPAPGGGSVSAAMGALGAALGTMVANLSSHKRGWDARWEEFSGWAEKGKACWEELLRLVDEDTNAFDALMAAYALPKDDVERDERIQAATRLAIEVPLKVMEASLRSMEVLRAMAEHGNPNSVSDAGVGALAARSAVLGAHLNVQINADGLEDKAFLQDALARGEDLAARARQEEDAVLQIVGKRMQGN
jgi:glutamate formiminotransferase / formiminotetrahydrofolate cyclodeaminase